MPTVFTHALVGIAAGEAAGPYRRDLKFRAFCVVAAVLPDADVLAFVYGIPYGHFLGHRGFFHSLFFALTLAMAPFLVLSGMGRRDRFLIFAALFTASASHGLLDALTDGGLGIALLSPFDATRYFFPWQPIRVSPIGLGFFSDWGMRALWSEIRWVWFPTLAFLCFVWGLRRSLKA